MSLAKNIVSIITSVLLVILMLLLPSVVHEPFMNETQTGKTIFLLLGILFLALFATLYFLIDSCKKYKFSLLDVTLLIWFFFIIAKSIIQTEHVSLHFAEFGALVLLYVILKYIRTIHFAWLFLAVIAAAGIQAIQGNLQLWGYYPSHHHFFKLTGSFFNPGPYAGYLTSVFPAALGFWLFRIKLVKTNVTFLDSSFIHAIQNGLKSIVHWLNKIGIKVYCPENQITSVLNSIGYYISAMTLFSILAVLPASQSRAGWLAALGASVYLFEKKYKNYIQNWLHKTAALKYIVAPLLVVIIFSGFTGIYFMKKGSADGRLLIWKVTTNMITDHPLIGTGMNGFKAHYMDYQAGYFKQNTDSEEAMVAGDTKYAFNELLQQTAEHGLPGVFLLGLVFITAFSVNLVIKKSDSTTSSHAITRTTIHLIVISKAMLLSFIIFSMFSYPVQILPIKISMVLALACLSSSSRKIYSCMTANKINRPVTIVMAKILVVCAATASLYFGVKFLEKQANALKDWKYAYTLYAMGAFEQSTIEYKKAHPVLRHNGDFLANYGKALSMAGAHKEAVIVLQEAAKYYPNTVVYTALGDSYKATGNNKNAEKVYLHAWYMNPSRFYPKYLLAKLYDETGQKEMAVKVAHELLDKKIKVESTAIEEIQAEMQNILAR